MVLHQTLFPNGSEFITSTTTNGTLFVPANMGSLQATRVTDFDIVKRLCTNWNSFFIYAPIVILIFTLVKTMLGSAAKKPSAKPWIRHVHHWAEWGSDYFIDLFCILMISVTLLGHG